MTDRLDAKIAPVTGGNVRHRPRRCGPICSRGRQVALTARQSAEGEAVVAEIREAGGTAIFIRADLAKTASIPGVIDRVVRAYGRLDCAFNNAGTSVSGPIETLDHAGWDMVIDTNLKASFFCLKAEARRCDIIRAFGVTSISVKCAVKRYRERGAKGFYAPRATRGAAVLTAGVAAEIDSLLVEGASLGEVAQKLGLKLDTLRKAVSAGRICPAAPKRPRRTDSGEREEPAIRDRLRRSDGAWGHGDAGTDGGQRRTAAEVEPRFERAADLPHGGVLPALLVSGMLSRANKYFSLPAGFYSN